MKRVALLAVIVFVCSASAAVALWREPLMSALGLGGERARYLGYIEGETSLIAPPVAGRLVQRPVERGVQRQEGRPAVRDRSGGGAGRGCARRGCARRIAVALREPA